MATESLPLPTDIGRELARLRVRIHLYAGIRGVGMLVASAVIAMTIGLTADWAFDLSIPVRIALLAGTGLICVTVAWFAVFRPLIRNWSSPELAAIVENVHPDLEERLTSSIELNDPDLPDAWRGSQYMREQLAEQTARSMVNVDVFSSISPAAPVRSAGMGIAALILVLLPLLLAPSGYQLLVSRFFRPWENFARPANLYFVVADGDRMIARRSDLVIRARPQWRRKREPLPEVAWFNWTGSSGETDSRRMEYDVGEEAFVATLPHVLDSLDFSVSAGSARSREYHIDVVERPRIASLSLEVQPPVYCGKPAETHDGAVGRIEVFERSKLRFRLAFNRPVEVGTFHWLAADAHIEATQDREHSLQLSADHQTAKLELDARFGGRFSFQLLDEFGIENPEEPDRELVVIPDQPPDLHVAGGDEPEQARPDDVIPVSVTASDDIGLGALEFHYSLNEAEAVVVPLDESQLGRRSVAHEFELNLASLDLQQGSRITYRVRAADERPVPEPHEVWSNRRTLIVSPQASPPGTTQLAREQEAIKQELERIRKELAERRQRAADLRNSVQDSEQQQQFDRNEDIGILAHDEQQLAEDVEQLAERLDEHPLFANLTQQAREAARNDLPEASRQARAAERADRLVDKVQPLTESEHALVRAEQKLSSVRDEFDDRAALERDLMELNRLAQQSERLADDALKLDEDRRNSPNDMSPLEQQARNRELAARQRELMAEQEELSQALNDLLERRPELLDAARRDQLDRLQQLASQALQMSEPQNRLAEALRDEARDTAGQAETIRRAQEKLFQDSSRLADNARNRTDATPPDPEQLRAATEELKRGNLEAAEKLQNTTREELERLADALHTARPNPDGMSPQQLARTANELARRQAELRDQTEQLVREQDETRRKEGLTQAAEQQRQLSETTRRLPDDAGPRAEALRRMQEATAALNQDEPGRAAAQQQQAGRALRETAEQAEQAERQRRELAQNADQLAGELAELARQVAELRRERTEAAQPEPPRDDADTARTTAQPDVDAPGETDRAEQASESQPSGPPDDSASSTTADETPPSSDLAGTQAEQQRVAQEAARLARQIAERTGQNSQSSENARQMAEDSQRAASQAQAGRFEQAARSAHQAAEQAQAAARSLAASDDQDDEERLARQAQQFSQQQGRLAEQFEQQAGSPATRNQTQQSTQRMLSSATEELARQLSDVAERLASEPLSMESQGERAGQAHQRSSEALAAMQRANDALAQANSNSAAEAAQQATQALRQAGEEARQANRHSREISESPVPGKVGSQIAQAARQLREAARQLAQSVPEHNSRAEQSGQPRPTNDSSQPGQAVQSQHSSQGTQQASASQNGQPGTDPSRQQSQGSEPSGEPAFAASNEQSPSPLSGSAESLRQAAQSLAQAAQEVRASTGHNNQPQQSGEASGSGTLSGNRGELPGVLPREHDLSELSGKDWGKLPGNLKTELLQAAQKKPNSDYARLIKLYFREIAAVAGTNDASPED